MIFRRLLCTAAALLGLSSAHALELPGPLVETAWLAENLSAKDLVILDVRTDLENFSRPPAADGRALTGHVPGSRVWDYRWVRENRVMNGVVLEKMVPTKGRFEATMRELGVKNEAPVVILSNSADPASLTMATRAYWTLKYYGHDSVSLLNGGLAKWAAERRPLAHDRAAEPQKTEYVARAERKELFASLEDVETALAQHQPQLIDSRTADFYVGQSITADVQAKGHIPGAKMLAYVELVDEKTKVFKQPSELIAVARSYGVDPAKPAIAYCNTGQQASALWFALREILGNRQVSLYDGSMHEWTKDPKRPVAKKWESD